MKRLRVLVVDDDPPMRYMCRRLFTHLDDLDVDVEEAASGEEAMEILRRERFDCVLSDYRMGAATGVDVLACALEHQPSAVRVMMTGYASPDLKESARARADVHEFVEKPMTLADLNAALLEAVVDRHLRPRAAAANP